LSAANAAAHRGTLLNLPDLEIKEAINGAADLNSISLLFGGMSHQVQTNMTNLSTNTGNSSSSSSTAGNSSSSTQNLGTSNHRSAADAKASTSSSSNEPEVPDPDRKKVKSSKKKHRDENLSPYDRDFPAMETSTT
jgi:hypothetical protein